MWHADRLDHAASNDGPPVILLDLGQVAGDVGLAPEMRHTVVPKDNGPWARDAEVNVKTVDTARGKGESSSRGQ